LIVAARLANLATRLPLYSDATKVEHCCDAFLMIVYKTSEPIIADRTKHDD